MSARRSAVQKKALSVYKSLFRTIETKPHQFQIEMKSIVRSEFRKRLQMDRKDFFRIDYFVKRAFKYLDILKHPSCENISHVDIGSPPNPVSSSWYFT